MLRSVVHHGSFSGAAQEWGVSQQAVSARMRSVEGLVGAELFVRSPRGTALTAAGLSLLPAIDRLLESAHSLGQSIEALSTSRNEHLDIGASQTIAEHLVPQWLVALNEADQSGAAVAVHVGNSRDVIELVRQRAVSIGFVETPDLPSDLNHAPLVEDELVLVVPPNHPWSSRKDYVLLDEVAALPLVLREAGSGTRKTLERAFAEAGLTAQAPALELGTSAAIRSAVSAGIAATVMSLRAVSDDVALERVHVVRFGPTPVSRPLSAVWSGQLHHLSASARLLLEVIAR